MPGNYLKEGQSIRVGLPVMDLKGQPRNTVAVQVEKVGPDSFMVRLPKRDDQIMEVGSNAKLQVYITNNGYLFSGQSKVLASGDDLTQWLMLSTPDRIMRVEMRGWVRVPVSLNVRYRLYQYNWPYYEANSINLSAGGVLFLAPHIVDEKLELDLGLDLPGAQPINSVVEVTRCALFRTRWGEHYKIGCRFKDIQEKTREKLIQFVFQAQKEMIKKGRV